jgi:hypothetical protein
MRASLPDPLAAAGDPRIRGLRALVIAALAASIVAGAGVDRAQADHEIDRVEGSDWYYALDRNARLEITRTGDGTFSARLASSPLGECFPTGTLLYQFSGHEPSYSGVEYLAVTDDNGDCTGAFNTTPATFSVNFDRSRLVFTKVNGRGTSVWYAEREDEDGDALYDDEERSGYNDDIDPETEVDLRAIGADPRRKDIFVELDHMSGHEMSNEAIARTVRTFQNAPVSNPDGSSGISLHVDAGPRTLMDPRTGGTWGELSEANEIGHRDLLGRRLPGGRYDWGEFDQIKQANFHDRSSVFHYAIAAHGHPGGWGGEARGMPSSDFMLAFGCPGVALECNLPPEKQAMVFMHELGHNLGLDHGGADRINYKPNLFSIMNYNFAYGIPLPCCRDRFVQDYSRFDSSAVPSLDEAALTENRGVLATGAAAGFGTFYQCPGIDSFTQTLPNRPVDFNCDGSTAGVVSADVTGDRVKDELRTYNEWSLLQFDGGAIGGAFSSSLPEVTPSLETSEYGDVGEALYDDFKRPKLGIKQSSRGRRVRVRITARDERALDRLIVQVGGSNDRLVERSPSGKRASFGATVPKGTRVAAAAVDVAGHAAEKRIRARG